MELFKTQLLVETENEAYVSFVNEFLEEFMKLVAFIAKSEPAMIRRLLLESPGDEAEESKEEEMKWDETGLIPLLFRRVASKVP